MNVIIKIKVTKDADYYHPMSSYLCGYMDAYIDIRKIPVCTTLSPANKGGETWVVINNEDIDAKELMTFIANIAAEIKNVDGYEMVIEAE